MIRLRAGALLIVVFVGIACSEDPGGVPQTSASTQVEIDIDMSDYRFAPAALTVVAGAPLRLSLRNSGSVVHNWAVLTDGINAESELDEAMTFFRAEAPAGAQRTFSFEPPPVGVYQVICTIPTHFSLGMKGSLTVEEAPS